MHNPVYESFTKLQRKTLNRECKVEINKGQRKCIVQPNKAHKNKTKKSIKGMLFTPILRWLLFKSQKRISFNFLAPEFGI